MDKKLKPQAISRAIWDFSQCPQDELSFCVAYEYLREFAIADRQRAGKDDWSTQRFAEMFYGYFRNGKRIEFKVESDGLKDPFEINLAVKQTYGLAASSCTGFPDSPYLELLVEERRQFINDYDFKRWRPDQPTMAQENFVNIYLNSKEALIHYQYHVAEWVRQHFEKKLPSGSERKIVHYDGFGFELGVIRLNWSCSDNHIIDSFKGWLKNNRPPNVERHEKRGSAKMSEYLKYLSALRLLDVMSATKANNFTHKICGKSLYEVDENWYDARKKANRLMLYLSTPFFDPA